MIARAAAGAPEGLWLRAECQTGGKGRQGRMWVSPPGNLYLSTLVRVRPNDPPAPTLALVAAVALHDTLGPGLTIKWPNDIMAGEAKLAGILLERAGDAVVVGFGANLAYHPGDLDRPVTSIAALRGSAPEANAMAERLADLFAAWLGRWRQDGLGPLRAAWLATAHAPGTLLTTPEGVGRFDGLDEAGALKLRLADGSLKLVHAGDVFLL